jgi:hypothetical protein
VGANQTTDTAIRCSECEHAVLERRVIHHDVGRLVGMTGVRVTNLPALVCPRCGAVSVDGELLNALSLSLAALILEQPTLDGIEVRFLRKLMGDTQSELAEKVGVDRVTVNRWENSSDPIDGAQAYALRCHTFLRLRESAQEIAALSASLVEKPKATPRSGSGYVLDGSDLSAG